MFEFLALVPVDQIEQVVERWVDKDANVKAAFDFLKSDRYTELVEQQSLLPEFQSYLRFLEDARAPAFDLWNLYRLMIGLDPMRLLAQKKEKIDPASVLQMVDECLQTLDKKEFEDLYNRKMEESADFKYFFQMIDSAEHITVREALKNNAAFKKIVQELLDNGFDTYATFNKIFHFFFPPTNPF